MKSFTFVFIDGAKRRREDIVAACAKTPATKPTVAVLTAPSAAAFFKAHGEAKLQAGRCLVSYHLSNQLLNKERDGQAYSRFLKILETRKIPYFWHTNEGHDPENGKIGLRGWLLPNLAAVLENCARQPVQSCEDFWTLERSISNAAKARETEVPVRFAALDLLVQAYLIVRDPQFSVSIKSLQQPVPVPVGGQRARDVTVRERLVRPEASSDAPGRYWFDECAPDLQEVFCATMDTCVEGIEKRSGVAKPTLGEVFHSERSIVAGGALRRLVEIIRKGNDAVFGADSRWPNGFLTRGRSDEDVVLLMRKAHGEYVEGIEKIRHYE